MNNEPLGLGTIIVYVRGEASPHSQCMWMLTLCRTKRRGALFPQRERGAMRHPQMWPGRMPFRPVLSAHREHFFLRFFFFMSAIFKVFIEFATLLLLLYVLAFWFRGAGDLSSLTRDRTCASCTGRWKLNHWATREVPTRWELLEQPLCLFGASLAAWDHCDISLVQRWLSKSFLTRDGDGSDPINCRGHTVLLTYPWALCSTHFHEAASWLRLLTCLPVLHLGSCPLLRLSWAFRGPAGMNRKSQRRAISPSHQPSTRGLARGSERGSRFPELTQL